MTAQPAKGCLASLESTKAVGCAAPPQRCGGHVVVMHASAWRHHSSRDCLQAAIQATCAPVMLPGMAAASCCWGGVVMSVLLLLFLVVAPRMHHQLVAQSIYPAHFLCRKLHPAAIQSLPRPLWVAAVWSLMCSVPNRAMAQLNSTQKSLSYTWMLHRAFTRLSERQSLSQVDV